MNYNQTDERLHQICQTLAKMNRSFVPGQKDDSHTNLYFDELGQRITGHWIQTSKGNMLLSFSLTAYAFEWQNAAHDLLYSYAIEGKTIEVYEAEIEADLNELGLEGSGFRTPLHFDIPEYAFRDAPVERPSDQALAEWMQLRSYGNQACQQLCGYAQVETAIRIWPHHFDTGVYFEADHKVGIGFGLAMKDSGSDTPYFYLSAYPNEGSIDYHTVPEIGAGQWMLSDGFNGAILKIDRSLDSVHDDFPEYMKLAFNWLVNQV